MAYNTLGDLDSLISSLNTLSNQAEKRESKRYSRDASIYDEFNSDVDKTYSNSELDIINERVNGYINNYGGDFNELSVENFSLLKDKIRFQREDNERYETGLNKTMSVVGDYGKHMEEAKMLSNMTETEFEYNGIMGTKEGHIQATKDKMLTSIQDYASYSEQLTNNFSSRLNDPSQIEELYKIQSHDDMFRFGLNDAFKDNYIDQYEFESYNQAINTKSYEPIKIHKIQKQNNDKRVVDTLSKQAETMYSQINLNDSIMDNLYKFREYVKDSLDPNLSEDERFEAQKNREIMSIETVMQSGKREEPHLFKHLLNDKNGIDENGELLAMIYDDQAQALDNYEKLGKLDNQYTSATGGYGFETLGLNFNSPSRNTNYINPQQEAKNNAKKDNKKTYMYDNQTYNISDDSLVVVSPQKKATQLVNKELLEKNITTSNIDQDVSEIKDEYKKGNKYSSGETKLRNESEALNQKINKIETSTIMGNPEGSGIGSKIFKPSANKFYDFNNYTSRDGGAGIANYTNFEGLEEIIGSSDRVKNGQLNYKDLAKLELKYNEDILKKPDLVKDYKQKRDAGLDKNLPEMKNLQNEINKIYMRWFARSESDLGFGKESFFMPITREWNLALEEHGGYNKPATPLYKFMNFLRLRFNEDKEMLEQQQEKYNQLKNNLK